MPADFHTSRCAKCGALSAMPHAFDVACIQGPHDWRTLVEQRDLSLEDIRRAYDLGYDRGREQGALDSTPMPSQDEWRDRYMALRDVVIPCSGAVGEAIITAALEHRKAYEREWQLRPAAPGSGEARIPTGAGEIGTKPNDSVTAPFTRKGGGL